MKKSTHFILLKIALPIFGAFLMICGCQKDDSSLANPGASEIWITHNTYYPNNITIPSGTTVTWINKDNYNHTVTSNINGLFDSGQIHEGRSFSHKFNKQGTYSYYCKNSLGFSGSMIGVIEVK